MAIWSKIKENSRVIGKQNVGNEGFIGMNKKQGEIREKEVQGVCANWNKYEKCHIREDAQDVQIKFCFQFTWTRKAKLAKLDIFYAFKLQ